MNQQKYKTSPEQKNNFYDFGLTVNHNRIELKIKPNYALLRKYK